MKLIRNYYDVKNLIWSDRTEYKDETLYMNKEELSELVKPLMKNISKIDFEIVKPGKKTRIVHVLDTIQPMIKVNGNGKAYSGFLSHPDTIGEGETNLLRGFAVMESAPLPWEDTSASSGLLYPRDAIVDMVGPISGLTPFSETFNLVMVYELMEGKSSLEYDNDIRLCALKVSEYLAALTKDMEPNESEEFCTEIVNHELPNVVFVWQNQNQGIYANTYLYGKSIDNLVPTILHPNEMLDGCVVSGNYVWPAFKVPTYLHVNHPIVLDLFRRHGKELNFVGVIYSRSHNPSHWEKERCANICIKHARMLKADGLIMAWEGGGNAATDGMLTIQGGERNNIKAAGVTFEFGGKDGTEGILLVDDVPEANAIVSGGSIEKDITLPEMDRAVGGDTLRLNKESGGYFPPATDSITFDTLTQLYCGGNQCAYSKLTAHEY